MLTFTLADMPNMATHCEQAQCGFSLYRGVLVQWDEDHDDRVLRVLDAMPAGILDRLLVVQEHEGVISFLWQGYVPAACYFPGQSVMAPDGDVWSIGESKAVRFLEAKKPDAAVAAASAVPAVVEEDPLLTKLRVIGRAYKLRDGVMLFGPGDASTNITCAEFIAWAAK